MKLQCDGSRILVNDKWWRFSKPVLQAVKIQDTVLVIFDYMSYANGKPAPNLIAYDDNQKEIWTAENPNVGGADAYVNFLEEEPLKVWNFARYVCYLDLKTGKLIKADFTK